MTALVVFIALLTLFRLWAANQSGVFWDEAYYWYWSRFLAPSYYDHPPMVALWIRGSTALFGDEAIGLRLPFVLVGAAVAAVAYATAIVLFDRQTALRAALWVSLTPLFAIAGILATPDPPTVLFWSLAILAFAMVIATGKGHWWLLVGLFAGLGIVSKYIVLFLGVGIVLALAVDRDLRRWLISPWTWAGGAIAFAVAFPVIRWDFFHGGGAFATQFARTETPGIDPEYFLRLVVAQPFAFNAFAAVFVAIAIWRWLRRRPMPWRRESGILLMTAAPLTIFLALHSLHAQVLQHWLAPIYPSLTLVAAALAGSVASPANIWLARAKAAVVPTGLVCTVLVLGYAALPWDRFVPTYDVLKSLRGWPDFAADVEEARQRAGAAWIATLEYDINSEVVYGLRNTTTPVVQIFERGRYAFAPPPDPGLLGERAIVLVPLKFRDVRFWRGCFAKVEQLETIIRRGNNRPLDYIVVFAAEGPRPDLFDKGCGPLPEWAKLGTS